MKNTVTQLWAKTCSTSSITTPEVKGTMSVLCSRSNTQQLCVCVGLNYFSCDLRKVCLRFSDFVPSSGHRVHQLFFER